ncbi:MAG: hypothetical protein ACYDEJ_16095 [Desulfitobacteriaceae bacterium]
MGDGELDCDYPVEVLNALLVNRYAITALSPSMVVSNQNIFILAMEVHRRV